jgi:catechol 2,3-dioxygenase-like lactoylglutathione lyase family enzyme
VPVTDFATARAFYKGTLGLRVAKEDGFALVLDANGITLRVVKLQKFEPVHYTVLGWEVKGIESVVLQLQQKGVAFERYDSFKQDDLGIWITPNGDKVAWFKDPDGNTLSVSEHV